LLVQHNEEKETETRKKSIIKWLAFGCIGVYKCRKMQHRPIGLNITTNANKSYYNARNVACMFVCLSVIPLWRLLCCAVADPDRGV